MFPEPRLPGVAHSPSGLSCAHRRVEVFFTRRNASGPAVSLWTIPGAHPSGPLLEGSIGRVQLVGYAREGISGAFLSFVHNDPTGARWGTANLVVSPQGMPRLLARRQSHSKESIWASVSRDADDEFLATCGIDLDALTFRRLARTSAGVDVALALAA